MRITRRGAGAMTAMALAGGAFQAQAQDPAANWPNKPVKMIVNFGPGGSTDNAARPFCERLSRELGQQFVIENRGGASGALGLEAAMKSPADGYTFVATPALSVVILPHMRKTPFDVFKDFVPVSRFTNGTLLFAVHPSVPANTIAEFVDHAKKNPGKLSWGTAGYGAQGHLILEAFKLRTGTDILHVPYRGGGEALADFLAGVVQVHADPNTLPHVASGKGRLLAIFDDQRLPEFPNVPLMKEIYPDLDYLGWFAIFAPAGTPDPIVRKFSAALRKVASDPELKAHMAKFAIAPNPDTPEQLATILKSDFERYGKLVRQLNLRME